MPRIPDIAPTYRKPVRLLDLAILIYHIHKGVRHKNVGFEDCKETLETLTRKLESKRWVEVTDLASALWSSNLLDEHEEWFHPYYENFDDWVRSMLGTSSYSRIYGMIEDKEK